MGEQAITIEKGVPMPGMKGRLKYPWHQMAVGDSFFVGSKNGYSYATWASKQYAPKRFEGRMSQGGIRIWRVK